jgi:hypothetical protein
MQLLVTALLEPSEFAILSSLKPYSIKGLSVFLDEVSRTGTVKTRRSPLRNVKAELFCITFDTVAIHPPYHFKFSKFPQGTKPTIHQVPHVSFQAFAPYPKCLFIATISKRKVRVYQLTSFLP